VNHAVMVLERGAGARMAGGGARPRCTADYKESKRRSYSSWGPIQNQTIVSPVTMPTARQLLDVRAA